VVGIILCGLVAAGSAGGRSFEPLPALTLEQPSVTGTWSLGWYYGGSVRVSGTVAVPARLRASVRSIQDGKVYAGRVFSSPAGRYNVRLRLPRQPLPGRYRVVVVGVTPLLRKVERIVTVQAPPEGVVDNAVISARRNGPAARVLRGPRTEAWARFHFLSPPPRAREVTIQWKTPSGRLVCQSPTGPLRGCELPLDYARTVHTFLRSTARLAYGNWEARISVGGKLAKRAFVRLRR
jgi:hypothetical protein